MEKNFDAIKFVREQRDRLDKMFSQMSKAEIIVYLKKVRMESKIIPSA